MSYATNPIRIVANDRERAGGVIEVLRSRADVALAVQRLDVGDFRVEENFVVERKTLGDFAASVIDGRWFRQAAAMAAVRPRTRVAPWGLAEISKRNVRMKCCASS